MNHNLTTLESLAKARLVERLFRRTVCGIKDGDSLIYRKWLESHTSDELSEMERKLDEELDARCEKFGLP